MSYCKFLHTFYAQGRFYYREEVISVYRHKKLVPAPEVVAVSFTLQGVTLHRHNRPTISVEDLPLACIIPPPGTPIEIALREPLDLTIFDDLIRVRSSHAGSHNFEATRRSS